MINNGIVVLKINLYLVYFNEMCTNTQNLFKQWAGLHILH